MDRPPHRGLSAALYQHPTHSVQYKHRASLLTNAYFKQMSFFFHSGRSRRQQICSSVMISEPPPPLASLFVYSHTELVMGAQPLLLHPPTYPTHPPPHYLLYLMGPLLFPPPLSPSTFIYIFIHSTPALRVTVFNIIGET